MANNILEMVGTFIPGTLSYPITIPDFIPNTTAVLYVKVEPASPTYSRTVVVMASTADYEIIQQGDGSYNIVFKTAIVNQYKAFVVRQPYTKPTSTSKKL